MEIRTNAKDVFEFMNINSSRPMKGIGGEFQQFWVALTAEERDQFGKEARSMTAPPTPMN